MLLLPEEQIGIVILINVSGLNNAAAINIPIEGVAAILLGHSLSASVDPPIDLITPALPLVPLLILVLWIVGSYLVIRRWQRRGELPLRGTRRDLTLIVYTNELLRNADGSTRQESERHRVVVWGLHAEKAARLLTKGSKIHIQGRMTYPTWKDKHTGETRYGAEIVVATLDYQGADDEEAPQDEQPAVEVIAPQPAKIVALAAESAPAKPKRSRSKKAQAAAA